MPPLAFYEDSTAGQFTPIAHLRPVFELLCGHFSNRQRQTSHFRESAWGAILRPELAEVYAAEHPTAIINDDAWLQQNSFLLMNGRCLLDPLQAETLVPGTAAWIGDTLAAVAIDPRDRLEAAAILQREPLEKLARGKKAISFPGTVLNYPWDLVMANSDWLRADFARRTAESPLKKWDSRVAIVGPEDQVFIHESVQIDPFVVIDSTNGPVWIDQHARIQAFTRIEGPAWIGPGTQLFRANVREGCSFGPVCRLGGELEESIVHGYANKYHDGFLGHSYVCPWVNLGALTTNSDLKNDYSSVSVPLGGMSHSTGTTKVGCFIGDHTKTALGSLINTGSAIGVMSLVLPAGELLPKHIPSFTRYWHGRIEPLPGGPRNGFETARTALSRRGKEFTPAMERLLEHLFAATEGERSAAFARQTASSN